MGKQVWFPVALCGGRYEISNDGNYRAIYSVTKTGKRRNLFSGNNIKPRKHGRGKYYAVAVPILAGDTRKTKNVFIHKLGQRN